MKLIVIAGGPATGKSLFAQYLSNKLRSSLIIPIDSYYFDKPNGITFEEWDVDTPTVFDFAYLQRNINELRSGKPTEIPEFNFLSNRRAEIKNKVYPAKYILIDGIYSLLNDKIRYLIDYSFFLESPLDVLLARRILKDIEEKRALKPVLDRYFKFIKPAYYKYVEPTKRYANKIIVNDFNTDLETLADEFIKKRFGNQYDLE
jgi:uridine kinase